MKLIVGLGNPGNKYRLNRHNVGFIIIDYLAEKLNCKIEQKLGKALYCKTSFANESVILIKPQTYMNLSGESVSFFINYFKIDIEDLIVIYDDLDLEFGKIRIREKGSAGGQKGMISIIQYLNTETFLRVRVGINRPPEFMDAADYVLSNFLSEEINILKSVADKCTEALQLMIKGEIKLAMNNFNG